MGTVLSVVRNAQPLSRVKIISMTVLSSDQRLAWGAIFGNHASQLPFFPVTRSSGYLFPSPNLDLHPILSPSVVRWKLASESLWEHF